MSASWLARIFGSKPALVPEPPIRSELFSVERLEQHAETLAAAQHIIEGSGRGRPITPRLKDNSRVIVATYRAIVSAAYARQPISPAAEWLLDNYHVVDEQIREIEDDLPPGFYRKLPKLADGHLQGYPRVFGLAWALVAHTDSAFDVQKLTRFVEAYQREQPLTIGELWAIAITLRITLVENLRRLAEAIVVRLEAGRLADDIADRSLGTEKNDPEPADEIIKRLNQAPWSTAFAFQLAQRMRDRDPNTTPALRWLNEKLHAEGSSVDQVVRDEVQRQSAMNVTVRNVITSMRMISMVNWAEFFESVSPVDAILRTGSNFASMDFPTRDTYRRAIEQLALGCNRNEPEVATKLIAKAQRGATPRERDPGYYLLSKGRSGFEAEIGCKPAIGTRAFRLNSRLGVLSYVGMIAITTAIILMIALSIVARTNLPGWTLVLLAITGLVPASDVAVAIVNRFITMRVGAMSLPGMALRDGVPASMRTIIVVPTLLTSISTIEEQVERLEVHHLSNSDENFVFALLSDWGDADSEHDVHDDHLLATAAARIAQLNERYGPVGNNKRFFLLHRKRLWNAGESKWMGWERKRGKLHELNQLLRGATDTTFMPIDGQKPSLPSGIKYVITLDADTRLPIGVARRLVGKMAHPLNQPRFDHSRGLVVEGHGILQPRVTPSLPAGSKGSLFQRVFSGPNGLDPYALAVSDVYQDLFEEGSYCGKGIYDVDIFEAALDGQIPESTVLSHDLLEGILSRAGLASDIEVVEEFPSRYSVAAARQHRWVRGDWQLLPWIFGLGGKSSSDERVAGIPLMGRWKMLDNLRRSLSAPAAMLAMLIAWLQKYHAAEIWTAFILLTIALPPLLPAIAELVPRRRGVTLRNHLRALRDDFALGVLQSAFLITFLAHQAWMMVDAVARTLFRLFIRRRKLLEWVTAAQLNEAAAFDRRTLAAQIGASAVFAVLVAVALYYSHWHGWRMSVPFGVLWVLSPVVARWASAPAADDAHFDISTVDADALRLIARRTWRFFEKFVTPEDNVLPPDNFQETPTPVVAHRTSPTNIGLYLISAISARDFGWIGTLEMVDRLEATFATLAKMEKQRGHFYNWYDTTNLRPLEPRYISSVDSGNLAGHLIALGNACLEIVASPICNTDWVSGLEDSLALARQAASGHKADGSAQDDAVKACADILRKAQSHPGGMVRALAELAAKADSLVAAAKSSGSDEVTIWAESLRAGIATHQRDAELLMPWAPLAGRAENDLVLLATIPSLGALAAHLDKLRHENGANAAFIDAIEKTQTGAQVLVHRLTALAETAKSMANEMEFGFMFDPGRQLLSIGYRCNDGSLDPNFYDLLASEARLASFFAIAKGDVPAEHWFHLGRTLTPIDGGSGLVSWSGSMFEYLMPSLVMRAPAGSLLEDTNTLVVRRQEQYGNELGIPWGISESEFNARDMEQTYQYSSFGVPDLGFKRGLGESTVIAPYATGLAAMVDPAAARKNYTRMAAMGARGAYGWYEAIDFTRARLPEGKKYAVVNAYMAHHQAMSIVGIGNALHDGRMRTRFHAEPMIQAAELLLQERMPRDIAMARPAPEQVTVATHIENLAPDAQRRYDTAHSRVPRTHLMANGRYALMLTATGSGYSRWRDVAITRWREDVTRDNWGTYVFLRDVRSGETWSAGYAPSIVEPDSYDVTFADDRAEIVRSDGSLTTTMEVAISPEDDAEVRRISITNHGTRTREIDLTSYAEVSLARQADDVAHPAFAKLFVDTEFVPNLGAVLATRRQRSSSDPKVWAAHLAVVEGESAGDVQFETDRARFLGRGQTVQNSIAITDGWPLSNTSGAVLDPIFSLRRRVKIPRGATVRVAFWTLAAETRDEIIDLADRHHDSNAFERATTLAWTQTQMQLRHLGVSSDEAHIFQRLANHVLYTDPTLRPPADTIKRGMRKASTLWSQGISGDRPIILVRIEEDDDLSLVRQLLRAHEYWRLKQLAVDLVILNERSVSYAQDFQTEIDKLVRVNRSLPNMTSDPSLGAVYVLRADLVPAEVRDLLFACARAVLQGSRGALAEQINRAREKKPGKAPPLRRALPAPVPEAALPLPPVEFFNGLGGFVEDGKEYLTVLQDGQRTPQPWVNVIANPNFGFLASTDGSGFSWAINSQQNQITPWSNDATGDPPGEAIYLRDEDTGEIWTPTSLPIREKNASYAVRHGQGYSKFAHTSHGIALELLEYVPVDDSLKIARLKIANHSGRERRISVTAYVEWVLGTNRSANAPFIVTEIDTATGAIFAQNPWNEQFGERITFMDMKGRQTSWTCDRTEFLGRDGTLDRPLALTPGAVLSNRVGAGLDPCGAQQVLVRLNPVGTTEIVLFIGQSANRAEAQALIEKYRKADLDAVFKDVTGQWDKMLGAVQVKTPDRALDIMLNRWLVYQALSCRIWARTGFYQASGAYGFRDQLQDVVALLYGSQREIARAHLLRAAGRQFVEGDVQHWWLPESGRGIRTRVSDDCGWLAYVAARYVQVTGDDTVLDEMVPFLEGPVLREDEHDSFFQPKTSEKTATLFDHCALALDRSLKTGPHGLPLMGTGDWNDGMDKVGAGGKGESVWLGWFLCTALNAFATIAERRGADDHARDWRQHVDALKEALEREAWDGDWYRRAFFDDGTPLGSVTNNACRIDSIAQSWSVISRSAEPARSARALAALDKYLVRRDDKISLLFTPPFDHHPEHDPGYIAGYPPGIRENGGQYTHGATWAVMAFAMQGDGDRAGELMAMLNPIHHSDTPNAVQRYKVEPYVSCADVYSVPPHSGRGGWTWYTGSAGWTYGVALEWILGFRLQGTSLLIDPCIPRNWPSFEIIFRYHSATYEISVENPLSVCRGILATKLDGEMQKTAGGKLVLPLLDDGATHKVQVVLG